MIEQVAWSPYIEDLIKYSAGKDLQIISDQVKSGRAQLWLCSSDKNHGAVVTRMDENELVMLCGEGSGLIEFGSEFVNSALKQGMTVRTHVRRKGLIKMHQKIGLKVDEYILRNQ